MEPTFTLMRSSQMIDVEFKDISYAVRTFRHGKKKQILNGLTGYFRSGELTGILGPSGAGKSTLLNILSGFQEGLYTGTVKYLNEGNKQDRRCKKQLCYVQQTDNLHDLFTVQEIMMIASYLKINRSFSHNSRYIMIDYILNSLNLSSTKETRVGQLSGGQKKRLSIALELIDNPPLMFLDEPTTGLDSLTTTQCITMLKALTQAGRTVICTIHQPSAALYEKFDHIYLVVDGHCMYRSAPGNTVDYFAQLGFQCPRYHNPADYMLEVVSKEYGNYDEQLIAAAKLFAESNDEARYVKSSRDIIQEIPDNNETMIPTSPPSELTRFWVLLQRCAILAHRDRSVYTKIVLHCLVGALIGSTYRDAGNDGKMAISNASFLLAVIVYLFYSSMMSAVLKFPLEIDILRKERFNNWYQLRTYYMAMLVYTIPLHIIFAFIFQLITYYLSNQPLEFFRFCMFLLIGILVSFISEGMGLGLGAVFSPLNGTFIGSILMCFFLMFNGFGALYKHMTRFMYYISYLSIMRYAFNGMIQSIYGYHRKKLSCSTIYCHFRMPSMLLEEFDMLKPMYWFDVASLVGYFVVFWILAYMLLKKRLSTMY